MSGQSGDAGSPQVLCAACGAWFDLPPGLEPAHADAGDTGTDAPGGARGASVPCPLCRVVLTLDGPRRVRCGVPRTGRLDLAPRSRRRSSLRAARWLGIAGLVALAGWGAAVAVATAKTRIAKEVAGEFEELPPEIPGEDR